MLEALDLPALATALGQRLRLAGVPVTPERSARFARALPLVAPLTRPELYWTARAVFVSSHNQLPTFDRVFAAVFDPRLEPDEDRGDPYSPPLGSQAIAAPTPPPMAPVRAPTIDPTPPVIVKQPAVAKSLRELEKEGILAALTATGGNKAQAAAILEIDRSTLYKKLKDYDIES